MTSILLLAIGIGIAVALLGSVAFQFQTPIGYKIHSLYPNSNPDELPMDDMKRLLYLDEKWMKECVSVLPADSIINIANNVDRNFSHGE